MTTSSLPGRDTTGKITSVQLTIEVETGLVLHLDVPLGAVDRLKAAWSDVLTEVTDAIARVKADETTRIKAHLEALV